MPRRPALLTLNVGAHARRGFFEALEAEPTGAAEALEQIKAMYAIEEHIRDTNLTGEAKQMHRLTYSKPLVEISSTGSIGNSRAKASRRLIRSSKR